MLEVGPLSLPLPGRVEGASPTSLTDLKFDRMDRSNPTFTYRTPC